MNGVGRPSDYRPEYCEMLIKHMSKGLSFESFGGTLQECACRTTLYRWLDAHQEFRDAKKKGTIMSLLYLERIGLKGMKGKIKGFNIAAWYINMRNKHFWSNDGPRIDKLDDKADDRKRITVEIVEGAPKANDKIEEAETIEVKNDTRTAN